MARGAAHPVSPVSGWACPRCGRSFGRVNQSHVCAPGMAVDEWFADRVPWERDAFDLIVDHLDRLGPVVIEAVQVGVLLKRSRTFAEVRPRRDGLVLSVLLSRRITDPRITRVIGTSAGRAAHFIPLSAPGDVDDRVLDWLSESYLASPD